MVGLHEGHDKNTQFTVINVLLHLKLKQKMISQDLESGIQVLFTGGGTGVEMVLALMSPMMCSASLSA